MAHYAILNSDNVVTQVIVGKDEDEGNIDWEEHYGNFFNAKCKRTSYNTREGVHILGGEPFRKNMAGIGFTYDEERDAFIPPKPYPSWTFNEESCSWDPPSPKPDGCYLWNEQEVSWSYIHEE